jgi:uncharacterized protein YndB with AHSA1/START domain
MLANIEKTEIGYLARFERDYKHSVQEVWSWLTENEKLAKWFPELRVDELKAGGFYKFDMQDGTFEELEIVDYKELSVLEFMWSGKDTVRFELFDEPNGCRLILKEKLEVITDHTPKDLAGWHVCLDVIEALMDGKTFESRKEVWKEWYEKYLQLVK